MLDGPAVVRVNIFVRSISKIDDVTMVSWKRMQRPVITDTHMCLFYIYYTQVTDLMLGVSLSHITISAIIPYTWRSCVNIRRRNARRHAYCQRVFRPRVSNAACAAEVYNDYITDIRNHETQGIPSLPVDSLIYSPSFCNSENCGIHPLKVDCDNRRTFIHSLRKII